MSSAKISKPKIKLVSSTSESNLHVGRSRSRSCHDGGGGGEMSSTSPDLDIYHSGIERGFGFMSLNGTRGRSGTIGGGGGSSTSFGGYGKISMSLKEGDERGLDVIEEGENKVQFLPKTSPIPVLNTDSVRTRRDSITNEENSFTPFDSQSDFFMQGVSFGTRRFSISNFIKDEKRDWNTEIIMKRERIEEGVEIPRVTQELSSLLNNFIKLAKNIGKMIISEANLPIDEKTIRPLPDVGGTGGEKFIYSGIFFKLAIDEHGIYGGDMFSAKAVSRELSSLKAIQSQKIEGLFTPFMVIIDYRGFRIMATSLLPIDNNTLLYGSKDGGKTINDKDPIVKRLIKKLCSSLNLKEHEVGNGPHKKLIHGPVDLEAHKGYDDRYYILDTARLFPPFPPSRNLLAFLVRQDLLPDDMINPIELPFDSFEQDVKKMIKGLKPFLEDMNMKEKQFCGGAVFYCLMDDFEEPYKNDYASSLLNQDIYGDVVIVYTNGIIGTRFHNLLRSELVLKSKVSLSSDAFTSFETGEAKAQNEKDIIVLTNTLYDKTIPELCNKLLNGDIVVNNREDLCDLVHEHGINIRLLGRMRKPLQSNPKLDKLLFSEMIIRTIKTIIRAEMRQVTSPHEVDCLDMAVSFMNILFGNSKTSTLYWALYIKTLIIFKFGKDSLTDKEKSFNFDLRDMFVNRKELFMCLNDTGFLGVQFEESKLQQFLGGDDELYNKPDPFITGDIASLITKWKNCNNF